MRIAITGCIGAGKSFVCRMLAERGIEIYDCDSAAKRLMHTSHELRDSLTALIGPDTYVDGALNKPVVARFLLASEANKLAINRIVHPAVMADFYASGLQWMECAILFEAHLESFVDAIICVSAPEEVRIERIMKRDDISADRAKEWINAQMSQEEVERRSDYVIVNDGGDTLKQQIQRVLDALDIETKQK